MALRRPLPCLLAVLALCGSAASALDTTPRDLTRLPQVDFTELLEHPSALSGRELRFRCTIAERTDLFDVLRSGFRPERFYSLAVWDDRARLWEPEVRAAVSVGFFLNKDRFGAATVESLKKFTVVDIGGVVKEVVDGQPQVEVLEIRPVVGAGAVTDQAVYQIERALSLQNEARDLADVHFVEALKIDLPLPQRIDVLVLRARNLLALGEVTTARTVLIEAAELVKRDGDRTSQDRAQVMTLLAKALGESQSHADAVVAAREALALDPSQGEAYAVLGIGLAGLQQYEEARRSCDNAVRLRPADAEVRWYLGRILALQNRYDEAIEALKKAIDLTPKDHRIHLSIAEAYRGRGVSGGQTAAQDLSTALREVDITLRLKADLAEAQVLAGSIIQSAAGLGIEVVLPSGRVRATSELALQRYAKALEIAASSVPALVASGRIQLELGHPDLAQAFVGRLAAAGAVAEAAALQVAISRNAANGVAPVAAKPVPVEPQRVQAVEAPAVEQVVAPATVESAPVVVPVVESPAIIPPAP